VIVVIVPLGRDEKFSRILLNISEIDWMGDSDRVSRSR
jgi:hypothetical protein